MEEEDPQVDPLLDGQSYSKSSVEYEKKSDQKLSDLDTIILAGEGSKMSIKNRSLVLQHGRTHVPQQETIISLYAGTHHVRRIVILSDAGYVTFEAINWCRNHDIAILMLDRDGNMILTSGESGSDVDLRRLQYQASDTGLDGYIARELVRLKTQGQIEVLKTLPSHPMIAGRILIVDGQKVTIKAKGEAIYGELIWQQFEDGLSELSNMKDINTIRLLEGRLALRYWNYFIGIPINWKSKDAKIVPDHWKAITERGYSLSSGDSPRRALSPFHSILNYAYGILEAQVLAAINASGLDPACGCLHTDKVGRNSLVYDLMEPCRPLVDRLVLNLFAKTVFTRGMLVPLDSGEVRLSPQFARYVVASCMLPPSAVSETVSSFVKVYRGIVDSV
jgi:CRISP-associated protein Cas1